MRVAVVPFAVLLAASCTLPPSTCTPDAAADPATATLSALAATWTALAPLAGGPRQETGVAALDGVIYVVGGFDGSGQIVPTVEAFDPVADTWQTRHALPMALHHANVAGVGGKLYVLGFLVGGNFDPRGFTYAYDPLTDAWEVKAAMPAGTERGAAATAAIGARIYVAGGFRGRAVGDASVYETASDTWTSLAPLLPPREHLVGAAVDGIFYAIGGRPPVTGAVSALDPATGVWAARAPMPTARGGFMGAAVGAWIVVCGGEGNRAPCQAAGVFAQTQAYHPSTDTWARLPDLLTPRHGTGAATVGGRVYVPGGASREGLGAVANVDVIEPVLPP